MDAACSAAGFSLFLTLNQLGDYELLPNALQVSAVDVDSLRAWAERNAADFILFGRMIASNAGGFVCSLSLFDRAKGSITIERQSQAASVLEIFEATDGLIANMVDAMTGRHIGFGRIVFQNEGAKGSYRVFLDGRDMGKDLDGIGNVLIGDHAVRIVQSRMLGELELVARNFDLREGESLHLSFALPDLTAAEKARLESLEAEIRASWSRPKARTEIEAKMAEYETLLGRADASSALLAYRARGLELSGEWRLMRNRLDIEAAAWEPDARLFDPSMAVYLDSASYPDRAAIQKAAQSNALLLATLLELDAGWKLDAGERTAALESFQSILNFGPCLPADRRTAYIYAASALSGLIANPDPSGLKDIFGATMKAGKDFHGLSARVDARSPILLASDLGADVHVLDASVSLYAVSHYREGVKENIEVRLGEGKITYVDIGAPSFGSIKPIAFGQSPKPGGLLIRLDERQVGAVEIEIRGALDIEKLRLDKGEGLITLAPGEYGLFARREGDSEASYETTFLIDGSTQAIQKLPPVGWSKLRRITALESVRKVFSIRKARAEKAFVPRALLSRGSTIDPRGYRPQRPLLSRRANRLSRLSEFGLYGRATSLSRACGGGFPVLHNIGIGRLPVPFGFAIRPSGPPAYR